ncbi:hypothetical protein ACKVWC_010890 [Pyricularia oryzae]|uniref:Glycosyl hydrolase family 13 catalytic domain-containing protein n=1 Tax=Pyricularia oryzae TaxID=318829 RepID=A0A4P7NU48_PYROR|nr:hypothetical protein MCOR12_004019 [Pyricularia oryzae]QBZ65983.1 hypothetical protein PoMZ_12950 [Pyricularia oryzae]
MANKILVAYIFADFLFVLMGALMLGFSIVVGNVRDEVPTEGNQAARNLLYQKFPLTAGIVNAIFIFITFLLTIPALSTPARGWLKMSGYLVVVNALFSLVIGLFLWIMTLKTRDDLFPIWVQQTPQVQSLMEVSFKCCGYYNSTAPAFVTNQVCPSPAASALMRGCATPITSFANVFVDNIFTGVFGMCGIDGLLVIATACLLKDRKEQERFRHIDQKTGPMSTLNESDSGGNSCSDLGQYCGGTFKGLQSKLDYIRGMGFDAIWISPVVENHKGGYHGYWAKDLYAINPKYGTADDLKSLIKAAHDKGFLFMVDVVANHMGNGPISENKPAPLNQESSYHPECKIDYSNQQSVERCRLGNLPDLNTEDPKIRTLLTDWIKWIVSEFKVDGLRIDTVKHVEKGFWPGFAWASGVYTLGEVYSEDVDYLAGYDKTMGGFFNFPVYKSLGRYLQQGQSPQGLVDNHDKITRKFSDPTTLANFLDSHDDPRWLSKNRDAALLKNALAYVLLARGIPVVYYGTEQGFSGGADPWNREDLWRARYRTDGDLYRAISRLSGVRAGAGGLPADDQIHLLVNKNSYAFSRDGGGVVVLTTNRGSGFNGQECFDTRGVTATWEDKFGSGTYTSDESGKVCVQVKNGEPVVLVRKK